MNTVAEVQTAGAQLVMTSRERGDNKVLTSASTVVTLALETSQVGCLIITMNRSSLREGAFTNGDTRTNLRSLETRLEVLLLLLTSDQE